MPTTVPCDDVCFPCPADGAELRAFTAWPAHGAKSPAVVLIPDVRGVYDFYRDLTRTLAAEGFFAVALDIYSREGVPDLPDMDSVFTWIRELPDERVLGDVAAAVGFAASHEHCTGAVAVMGYCLGGQYALMSACRDARLSACVSWYGMLRQEAITPKKPRHALDMVPELHCPYLGLFGGDDALIPAADVEELRARLSQTGKEFEIRIYPGAGHAFFNSTRADTYRPKAAKDAWPRAVGFLRRHRNDPARPL
ncbi:MAG TPA: dienelactone hydrolase family protein [Candidatus Binatia bacterium]|nr:dienelactone hydrolase family protein [Candidatus Binatia bacterium]